MGEFIPATTGLSRVFIIKGRAGPENVPDYHSCVRAQALSQSFGDITDIECPDPTRPGQYVKIGSFQGAVERATISLEGRYALDVRSALMRMAKDRCPVDVQVHFGDCEDLSDHNAFKKVLFLHKAALSTYNTEDLGSLASGDTAAVNESADLSADEVFDIIAASWGEKGGDLVTTEVIDATICDEVSCGDCGAPSGGCDRVYVITKQAGGSPGTPADVVYSIDGGITWYAHDIDTLGVAEDPDGVACVQGYLVIVSEDSISAHYALLSEFDDKGTDPAFTEVATGFQAAGAPTCIVSVPGGAFIAGLSGHVYWMGGPSNGVTVLEDGTLTTSTLLAIAALNEHFVVTVGADGTILYSTDGSTFSRLTTPPVGVGVDILSVAIKNKDEWWVGTDAGNLYYTLDAGAHWTLKAFPQSGAGTVNDIVIENDSMIYLAYTYTTPAPDQGRVYASFNGGYDFVVMPLGSGLMPTAIKLNTIAACPADPELVVAGGIRTGADGIVIVGKM
jgi:hypothetical protein